MKWSGNNVAITGLAPVTSIGVGKDSLWQSLREGRSNVRFRTLQADAAVSRDFAIASMPPDEAVDGLDRHLEFLASQDCPGSRDLAYSMLAVELALSDAALQYDRDSNNIGVVQAYEAPGVERTVARLLGLLMTPPAGDGPPQVYDLLAPCFYNSQPFVYVHLLAKAFGLHGFSTSVHNACTSGAFALEVAAQQIRSGLAEVMLVIGGEAFDTAVRLEWFRRLDLYCGDATMRPLDRQGSGFYVGEGAGAIVLESEGHAAGRGAAVYGRYLGAAFAQQAWKQTIPDTRAARLAAVIREGLARSQVSAEDLDLVVPHGAAMRVSDGYEAECLRRALEGHRCDAVATAFKPHVGHMLAASGVIETICTLLAMQHELVPATLNTRAEDADFPVPLVTEVTRRPIRTALKLSTGFTGHDAASLFGRA